MSTQISYLQLNTSASIDVVISYLQFDTLFTHQETTQVNSYGGIGKLDENYEKVRKYWELIEESANKVDQVTVEHGSQKTEQTEIVAEKYIQQDKNSSAYDGSITLLSNPLIKLKPEQVTISTQELTESYPQPLIESAAIQNQVRKNNENEEAYILIMLGM